MHPVPGGGECASRECTTCVGRTDVRDSWSFLDTLNYYVIFMVAASQGDGGAISRSLNICYE